MSAKEVTSRDEILNVARDILVDRKRRKASQISREIDRRGLRVDKRLLNSVLHKEGRAYFHYDYGTYEHWVCSSVLSDDSGSPPGERQQKKTAALPVDSAITAFVTDPGIRFAFVKAEHDSPSFFSVRMQGRQLTIEVNSQHPMYELLAPALSGSAQTRAGIKSLDLFKSAQGALAMMLISWARLESQLPDGGHKDAIKGARHDWGRVAQEWLNRRRKIV